jgi:hypothetical protein
MNRMVIGALAAVMSLPGISAAKMTVPLDQVIYQVSTEAWVTTKSADVNVTVDATMDKSGLTQMRADMMSNFKRIADVEWHITQFNRMQDASGLERINAVAQARVPEEKLSVVREQAKSVSRPGANYQVSNIQFTPTLAEIEKVRLTLRDELYQKINEEITRLNKVYPQQGYTVHRIDFLGMMAPNAESQQVNRSAKVMMVQADIPSLVVSNKLQVSADVIIAANRDKGKTA